ncbi:hypothetical protein PVBG_05412 [Plasmodium vivax Brazil I]|uniref:Variable surface protein n=1 Tax=Plasmodium vivax (strain Brazil I) TaxID=1033975 RepID=A0A0J9T012_PLAV1|nr:hypothetical protein PVBG_05412 [Plasmodium vivax Brazil I]
MIKIYIYVIRNVSSRNTSIKLNNEYKTILAIQYPRQDPDLNVLPTNKFYQTLDDANGIDVYYKDCPTVKSVYNDHSDHHKFCATVVKSLKTLYNIPNYNIHKHLLCDYWNYWLYDRAIDKFKITNANISYSYIITYIFYDLDIVNKSIPSHQKCSYTNYNVSVEKFLQEKKFFDDNQKYENIKTIINSDNYTKYNKFFTYITENGDLYSKIKKECHCNNEEKFCVEFHKYNAENGKDQLCSLNCDSLQSSTDTKETPKRVCPLTERVKEVPEALPPLLPENVPVVNSVPETTPPTNMNPVTISSIVVSILFFFFLCYKVRISFICEY